jgi:hypothetical protein
MAERMMLSRQKVEALISSPDFLKKFPQFAVVQNVKQPSVRKGGCSGCRKRRNATNVMNAFITVLRGLPPGKMKEFKDYIKVGSILYNSTDGGRYRVGKL